MNSVQAAIRQMCTGFRCNSLRPPLKIVLHRDDFRSFCDSLIGTPEYQGCGFVMDGGDAGGIVYQGVIVVEKKCTCGAI